MLSKLLFACAGLLTLASLGWIGVKFASPQTLGEGFAASWVVGGGLLGVGLALAAAAVATRGAGADDAPQDPNALPGEPAVGEPAVDAPTDIAPTLGHGAGPEVAPAPSGSVEVENDLRLAPMPNLAGGAKMSGTNPKLNIRRPLPRPAPEVFSESGSASGAISTDQVPPQPAFATPAPAPEPAPAPAPTPAFDPFGDVSNLRDPEPISDEEEEGDATSVMDGVSILSALGHAPAPKPAPAASAAPDGPSSRPTSQFAAQAQPKPSPEPEVATTGNIQPSDLKMALARSLESSASKDSRSSSNIRSPRSFSGGISTSGRLTPKRRDTSLASNPKPGLGLNAASASGSAWSIGSQSGLHELPSSIDELDNALTSSSGTYDSPATGLGQPNPLQDRLQKLRRQLSSSSQPAAGNPIAPKPAEPNKPLPNSFKGVKPVVTKAPPAAPSGIMTAISPDAIKAYKSSLKAKKGSAFDIPTRRVSDQEIDAAVAHSEAASGEEETPPPPRRTMLGVPQVKAPLSPNSGKIHGLPRSPFKEPIGSMTPAAINKLWVEYVEANYAAGRNISRLKPNVFFSHLSQNHKVICQKFNCTKVKFGIKTTGKKVSLQAVPVRGS